MKTPVQILRALAALLLAGAGALALAVPALTAQVTDLTATLSPRQSAALEQRLHQFELRTGSQIAVLIVPTTAPDTIEQYALRVAELAKLGRKNVDDGALLLVAKDDHALRIEVGYGLEGALNDAISKRIVSDIITPYFQRDDLYGGVSAGVDAILKVVNGEGLPPPTARPGTEPADAGVYLPGLLLGALLLGRLLRTLLGRLPGAIVAAGVCGWVAWALLAAVPAALLVGLGALLFTLFGGGLGAMLAMQGGHGRYGGGSGGGFGGGFGGGGGGFGGGGASGRW